jgi:cobalt-zinc-cadmium efflux system outer membrane protein
VTARESLTATLELPWLGQREARIRAARGEEEVAAAETGAALADARHDLRAAWFSLSAAEEKRRVAHDQWTRSQRNAQAVRDLFEAGRVARVEVKRAEAEVAIASADAGAAEEEERGASGDLALLLGVAGDAPIRTTGSAPSATDADTMASVAARARGEASAVRIEAARLRAAEARIGAASRARWPTLGLEVGADFDDPTQPGTDKRVGLSFTFPLGSGPALDAAKAERDRQTQILTLEQRRAVSAAQSAWSHARTARVRFEALDREALPAAQEAAELARLAYREGRSDLFRLLEVERTLSQVELDRIDSYRTWALADADLRRLIGESES